MDFISIQLLTGLASASTLFLVSAGLTVIFGVTRVVNFAHGSLYMLGAYIAWSILSRLPRTPEYFVLGVLATALITAAISLWQGEYAAYPANWLIMGVVPVAVSWAIYTLTDRKLPNHLFIYIFLNAFFGAAIAIIAVGLASTSFVALSGLYPLSYLLEEYLPYFVLMSFSEAFITGMLITMMVIYKPEWVATFDDKRYLLDQ